MSNFKETASVDSPGSMEWETPKGLVGFPQKWVLSVFNTLLVGTLSLSPSRGPPLETH